MTERRARPSQVQIGGRKLVNVRTANMREQGSANSPAQPSPRAPVSPSSRKDFTPSSPDQIALGKKVEHPRFGIGEVKELEGSGSNVKATVEFPIGKKQLLLKFAKLRVVD